LNVKYRRQIAVERRATSALLVRGHFEGERVGTPFPLLKSCRNAWERSSHC